MNGDGWEPGVRSTHAYDGDTARFGQPCMPSLFTPRVTSIERTVNPLVPALQADAAPRRKTEGNSSMGLKVDFSELKGSCLRRDEEGASPFFPRDGARPREHGNHRALWGTADVQFLRLPGDLPVSGPQAGGR
jgi:hypothetical protein